MPLMPLLLLAATARADEDVRPGHVFKDCEICPEMVVLPAGSFIMGAPEAIAALDPVIPALSLAVIVLIVVSLATPAPAEERWRPFMKPTHGGTT